MILGPQKGPQTSLLTCPAEEICFCGARGGGKSEGIRIHFARAKQLYGPGARGIIFRRTYPELEDMIEKCQEVFPGLGGRFNVQKNTWNFDNGASLKLRQMEKTKDAAKYQGHEYTHVYFDEAGNWPNSDGIDILRGTMRSAVGVPCQMVLTSNPGGPGHQFIKRRFIDPIAPNRINRVDLGKGDWTTRVYIPSRLQDNRILMESDPGYVGRLRQTGPDWLVKAWLEGDWNVIAGGALDDVWNSDIHEIDPFEIPRGWRIDRSYDWGSSSPFSVIWWAESNGEAFRDWSGKECHVPAGTLFSIGEWYGDDGEEKGIGLADFDIAKGILSREEDMRIRGRVQVGPADSQIFDVRNGHSVATEMERAGLYWNPANKGPGSRVNGLQIARSRLKAAAQWPMEAPGWFVFSTCRRMLQHIPVLQRDPKHIEDVDTTQPDHDWDASRYRFLDEPAGPLESYGIS